MSEGMSWFIVVLTFIAVAVLARPATGVLLEQFGERLDTWSKARAERNAEPDEEQQKLWLWTKRRRLCAAIARIEKLLATDSWMSATRQLGNRLAYDQLVFELRRTPDVFPASLDGTPAIDLWAEPARARRGRPSRLRIGSDAAGEIDWSGASAVGCTSRGGAVEVLEIGWHRN